VLTQTNIEYFITLAETLSFTETSRRLFATQQAVSKSISRLEEDLGFSLFSRNSRTVALTSEGKQCYELFKSLKAQYEQSIGEIREAYTNTSSTLTVGYQNWLDFGLEPSHAFAELCREIPNLTLSGARYPPPILRDRLLSRQIDMAIMYDTFYNSLLVNQSLCKKHALFDSQLLIMVSPDNPKVKPESTYKDFVTEPFLFDIFEGESIAENNKRAKKIIEQCGLKPKKIAILPNRDSAYTEAELGRGMVVGAEINFLAKTRILKTFPVGVEETIVCIWRADDANDVVEKYADLLLAEYRKRDTAQ